MGNMKETALKTNLCIFSLALFITAWRVALCSRQLVLQVNPDCNPSICENGTNETSHINLVYVKATGEKDVLHYLWSTIGAPSVLMVQTSLDSELQIDWARLTVNDSLTAGSIKFTKTPEYFFSITLSKLWQFRDTGDTAKLDPSSNETVSIEFDDLIWDDIGKAIVNDPTRCSGKFVTRKNESHWIKEDGMLSLEVEVYGNDGRNDILPRLQHTINSTQLHFVMDSFKPRWKESRYGLEFLIVTSSLNDSDLKLTVDKTIDDEYTPGVFKTAELTSKSGGFMYWKPVVYTSPELVITNSTDAVSYDIIQDNRTSIPYSIAKAFLGSNTTDARYFSTSLTFGSSKDEFYEKTFYQAWTVMIGVGNVPQDTISLLVIVVISAGLGLPLLIMAIGGIYLLIDKYRKQKDDLLLSQDGR